MANKIKVYIADDHQLLTDSLVDTITDENIEVIGSALEGNSALSDLKKLNPDVVLMDIDLPNLNGLEITKQILEHDESFKVIILTMYLEKSLIEKAIKIGAKGYLPKNCSKDELKKAICEVANGEMYFSSEITTTLALGQGSSTLKYHPNLVKLASILSTREEEVLRGIADGLSNKEIATKLHLSPHTIDSHRKNIMSKTGINNTAGLIRFALKSGLVI